MNYLAHLAYQKISPSLCLEAIREILMARRTALPVRLAAMVPVMIREDRLGSNGKGS